MSDGLHQPAFASSKNAAIATLRDRLEMERRLLANAESELESARGELEAWASEVDRQARRVNEIASALEALHA